MPFYEACQARQFLRHAKHAILWRMQSMPIFWSTSSLPIFWRTPSMPIFWSMPSMPFHEAHQAHKHTRHIKHAKHASTQARHLADSDNANDVVDELFKSPISRNQIGLETSMRGSDFILNSVQLLYYKCHKVNFKQWITYRISRLDKKQETSNISKKWRW